MQGFDCEELLYTDFKQLPPKVEGALKARYVEDVKDMVSQCDVVTINCPLHEVGHAQEHPLGLMLFLSLQKRQCCIWPCHSFLEQQLSVGEAPESLWRWGLSVCLSPVCCWKSVHRLLKGVHREASANRFCMLRMH